MTTPTVGKCPTAELLLRFAECHAHVVDAPYPVIRGKDAKLLQMIWQSQGTEGTLDLIDEFFRSRDPWIRRAGYTVSVFVSQVGKLLARRAARKGFIAS